VNQVGKVIARDDGSRWRIVDQQTTSDGFVLGTGVLLHEDSDEGTVDAEGYPVIHSFFLGRAQRA